MTIDMGLSSHEFIQLLSIHYLQIQLIHLNTQKILPGSQSKIYHPSKLILCYDQEDDGTALAFSSTHSGYYLKGGLTSLLAEYTYLASPPDSNLDILSDIPDPSPIQILKAKQSRLAHQVWISQNEDSPNIILPFLYLSSQSAVSEQVLKCLGVTHILRLGCGYPFIKNVTVFDYPLRDDPFEKLGDWLDEMVEILHYVEKMGEKILVCRFFLNISKASQLFKSKRIE